MLAVKTGVDSFVDPESLGPLYPFVGTEVMLFGVAFFLWLAWHFLQARGETREHREACALYDELGLDRVMHQGGSALLPTDEEWAEQRRHEDPSGVRRDMAPGAAARPTPGDESVDVGGSGRLSGPSPAAES